jgi:serine/threonine protein phosphatase PrpC
LPAIVETIAFKSRQGFIPQMRKVNQDSLIVSKDFANMKDLYMIGVMDGHGVFGHNVSQFVKVNLPLILQNLIKGVPRSELALNN